jgi:hypothetical protein
VVIASGIEVSYWYNLPFLVPHCHRFQKHLYAQLRLSVGANGPAVEHLRAVVLLAVDGSGGGEKKLFAIGVFLHDF